MIESLSLNVVVCQSFGGTGDKKKLTSAKGRGSQMELIKVGKVQGNGQR